MSSSQQLFMLIIVFGMGLMLFLIIFLNSNGEGTTSENGAFVTQDGGAIYDLNTLNLKSRTKENKTRQFFVQGFKHSTKLPSKLKKHKSLRNVPHMWILEDEGSTGLIELNDFQPISEFLQYKEPKSVVVVVSYYLSWDHGQAGISISGIGTNPITKNREEQTETLSVLSVGESIQPTFCKKIIFLGPVDQVKVEGFIGKKDNYILISELRVAVGTNKYDNEEEVICK